MSSPERVGLEKDKTRRLLIRGLSHDYKRILSSLTRRASDFRKLPEVKSFERAQDAYKYFCDCAIQIADRLDRIGNEIYNEISIPATTILTRHQSRLQKQIDELVLLAEHFHSVVGSQIPDSGTRHDLARFFDQTKRARRQIQSLLALPFKENDLKYRTLNIESELKRIESDLYNLFIEYDCKPTETLFIDVNSSLYTDQVMFSIATSNIIANSVVHADLGESLRIKVTEETKSEGADQFVDLTIADNGPGISLDEKCEIFQLFKQGKRGLASSKGSGVGLTFARLAMELVGGNLTLKEPLGSGAAFVLRFPAEKN